MSFDFICLQVEIVIAIIYTIYTHAISGSVHSTFTSNLVHLEIKTLDKVVEVVFKFSFTLFVFHFCVHNGVSKIG